MINNLDFKLTQDQIILSDAILQVIKDDLSEKVDDLSANIFELCHQKQLTLNLIARTLSQINLSDPASKARFIESQKILLNTFSDGFSRLKVKERVTKVATLDEKFALARIMIFEGNWEKVIGKWKLLSLNELGFNDKFSLFEQIATQGWDSAKELADEIAELDSKEFTFEQLLTIYEMIEREGEIELEKGWWRDQFDGFDKPLEKEFQKCQRFSEKLVLFEKISARGSFGACSLARNFHDLGLGEASLETRLGLCNKLAEQAAHELPSNLFDIILKKDIPEQESERLNFWKKIACQGQWAAEGLAYGFKKLGLKNTSPEQRLDLCAKIAAHKGWNSTIAEQYFNQMGFDGGTIEQRLALIKSILAQWDPNLSSCIFFKWKKLRLEEATIEQRIELLGMFAKQRFSLDHERIIKEFKSIKDVSKQIDLWKIFLAAGGEGAANILVSIFDKLDRITQEDQEIFLPFIQTFAQMGYQGFYGMTLLTQFSNKGDTAPFKRQIELETLHYFRQLNWFINQTPYMPFLLIVSKREGAMISQSEQELFEEFLFKNPKCHSLALLYKEIKNKYEAKNKKIPDRLMQWFAYSAGIFVDLNQKQIDDISKSGLLQKIYHYQIYEHQSPLIRQLALDSLYHPEALNEINDLKKPWAQLSSLLLYRFILMGMPKEEVQKILMKIEEIPGFKDTKRFYSLMQLLLDLTRKGPFSKDELNHLGIILMKALTKKPPKKKEKQKTKKVIEEITSELQTLKSLLNLFGKEAFFACSRSGKKPQDIFSEHFQEILPIGKVDDFAKKYQRTFGSYRVPNALETYLSSLVNLPENEKKIVQETLCLYVKAVLNEEFDTFRYDTNLNPHLKALFEKRSDLREQWLEKAPSFDIVSSIEGGQTDYKKFFKTKIIVDGHLHQAPSPVLRNYLTDAPIEQDNSFHLTDFEMKIIELCKNEITLNDFLHFIKEKNIFLGVPLENDLKALIHQEGNGKYWISESDDPQDLLLIGSEIQGSCMGVNGESRLNKGLLGYLVNGETRAIVVKKGDKLVARGMLRLLWDEKNQTPVLFLERLYSNVRDQAIEKSIIDWAIAKSKHMKIPLVSKEVAEGEPYNGSIEFLGGLSPFVYSDANRGVQDGHKGFSIIGCHTIAT